MSEGLIRIYRCEIYSTWFRPHREHFSSRRNRRRLCIRSRLEKWHVSSPLKCASGTASTLSGYPPSLRSGGIPSDKRRALAQGRCEPAAPTAAPSRVKTPGVRPMLTRGPSGECDSPDRWLRRKGPSVGAGGAASCPQRAGDTNRRGMQQRGAHARREAVDEVVLAPARLVGDKRRQSKDLAGSKS